MAIRKGYAMKTSHHVIRTVILLGLWLGGAWAAQAQTRTVHLYYTDPQGTPLVKTDAQGNVVAKYDYTPYGNSVASLGSPPNGPGYTGHVNDPETGLVYMQARYYQPTGRFLSPDPVGASAGNIYGFNRYVYANNNPIVNSDPTGAFTNGTDSAMDGWGGWLNKTFWQDDRCALCLQTGSASGQVTNMDPVYVNAGATGSNGRMTATGHVTDAIFSTLFGTAFNEMKRPIHPTKIPNKLAHQLFMVNATGVAIAASPFAMSVGASVAPVAAEGGSVALGGAALRYGPYAARYLRAGVLAASLHVQLDPSEAEVWGPLTDVYEQLDVYEEASQASATAAEAAARAQQQLPAH
jgi:RHS repeat-associated protein